eukprot:Protomagalhaensia_wolfi_Nauph_80__485@NODE_1272_length_1617_cov_676_970215_g981_i0_p1_GENE_NODE_1272_length_1617_cov_676_970215_g981_i0NODE_1272_length_1617_cov_676_970215_g981_i0_p1_ORF_typecomplete_len333_score30_94_NODE_1272_length_1617_cov_676_970215_g981_i0891000
MGILAFIIGILATCASAQLTAEDIAQIKEKWPHWNYDYSAVANLASFAPMTTNRTYTIHEYSCADACCDASCDTADASTFESCLSYMDTSCTFTATISVPLQSSDFYCAFDNVLWQMEQWPVGAQIEWDLKWMHPGANPFYMYLNVPHRCREYYIGVRHVSDNERDCEIVGAAAYPPVASVDNSQLQINLNGFFESARGRNRATLMASCSYWDFNVNHYSGTYWFQLTTPGLKGVVYTLAAPSAVATTTSTTTSRPDGIIGPTTIDPEATLQHDFVQDVPDHGLRRLASLATGVVLSFLIAAF